ncbi:DUF6279 family lipoprotein [Aliivibrio kagoshimensis]|uniref:DUF6279 family lipoprotein n=1 Tax=Aliivibrio kagoshimensis TaxID=2910230 RepID=UPI003D138F5D
MIKNTTYRGLFLVFLLVGLSACSTTVIYNNLNWLTYWYLDDYVNLTEEQESEFDADLITFLEWHRGVELQNYLTHIMLIQGDINNGLDQTDIASYLNAIQGYWQKLLIRSEPGLVRLAYSLNDQQIAMFLAASEEKNRERVAKYEALSEQQRLADRFEKIEKRVEGFIGKLTPVQRELLNTTNVQLQPTFYDWIQFRRTWAHSVSEAYARRQDQSAFEQSLTDSILRTDAFRSQQYLDKIDHNEQLWIVTLTALINSLNEQQRKTLNKELDTIKAELEGLL